MPRNTGKKDSLGRSVWVIQFGTGRNIGGKRERYTERFHGTAQEAAAREKKLRKDLTDGVDVLGGRIAFDAYASNWLDTKRGHVSERTILGYDREVKRLCSIFGSKPLERIKSKQACEAMAAIRESINGRKGNPSESSVRASYRVMKMIFDMAVREEKIRVNPCNGVTLGKLERGARNSISREKFAELGTRLDNAMTEEYMAFYAKEGRLKAGGHQNKPRNSIRGVRALSFLCAAQIARSTGMRPSEIFALQWKHIDLVDGFIYVRQATETQSGGIKPTKSKAGTRDVEIDEKLVQSLSTWRSFLSKYMNSLGIELGTSSWVVCSDSFTQVNHSNFCKWWRNWADSNGFFGLEVYELRHTQVSLLLDAGVGLKKVQERVGHSSASVTLDVYAHAQKTRKRELENVLPW